MNRNHSTLILLLLFAVLINACGDREYISDEDFAFHSFNMKRVPLFKERDNKDIIQIRIGIADTGDQYRLEAVEILIEEDGRTDFLEVVNVKHLANIDGELTEYAFGSSSTVGETKIAVTGMAELAPGTHSFTVSFGVKEDAMLDQSFRLKTVELVFDGNRSLVFKPENDFFYRPTMVLRQAGQDGCDTYRIPGLVTTNQGTLIAVYDNRYNSSKDLQGDIDVGMSRSIDGGQTWEAMKVIMDMGEWGNNPERLNGTGDPCVLYDPATSTLWVAALWMSGLTTDDMLWWSSQPGMNPEETGQFLLVKSEDDGVTWSEPVNITEQIKKPEWQLLLQGPGSGITLDNGTLVFPAQFKADIGEKAIDGGQYTSHSTIIYSEDGGETWQIGNGAKPNTTEAQVVQLSDGSLMLNMRDDRNRSTKDETNGRAVATTNDMGQTWTIHPSSNSALPEPNCMASIISADLNLGSYTGRVLFFSNPDNKFARTNMTIKASLDEGNTWPEKYHVELNEQEGFGYSCMTMVDEDKIGILYEGIKELYFQVIPVDDVLGDLN